MSESTVFGHATNHEELVAALYACKEARGVSDRILDEISGLCHGHVSKLIGPGRERGLSQLSLDALLGALACKLIIVEDEAQAAIVKPRWESRDSRQLRIPARIGAAFLRRARPAVMPEFSRKGGLARWKGTSPELRKKLMQAVWKTRTKQAQLSASAPAEQTHGPADR
jgi:hypothetical protein